MQSMSKLRRIVLLLPACNQHSTAAAGDPNLEQKLAAKYALTTINAEGGVVTQGVVLTLRKNGFIADPIKKCSNDYKEGHIGLGGNVLLRAACAKVAGSTVRSFVAGEKLSITRIEVKDGVIFGLISDPIGDQRYKADLKFSVGKGAYIDFATAEQMISDAFAIAPADNQQQVSQQSGQRQGAACLATAPSGAHFCAPAGHSPSSTAAGSTRRACGTRRSNSDAVPGTHC